MLAIFDLDDTLIHGDSSNLFTTFLRDQGINPDGGATARDVEFLEAYHAGTLNLEKYMAFCLAPLKGWSKPDVEQVVEHFIDLVIRPRICVTMKKTLEWHRAQGHELLIISATGEHLVEPVAIALDIPCSIGIELRWDGNLLTGAIGERQPFREGKVIALDEWLARQSQQPAATWFYSDSHNDLPLLKRVDHPVAVNPDPLLEEYARKRRWRTINRAPQGSNR